VQVVLNRYKTLHYYFNDLFFETSNRNKSTYGEVFMKIWLTAAVIFITLTLSSAIQANPVSDVLSQSSNLSFSNVTFFKIMVSTASDRREERRKERREKRRQERRQARRAARHSVPELNASVAPLGLLTIGGLLAAGFERRRKKLLGKKLLLENNK
jgi:hypothetical protein